MANDKISGLSSIIAEIGKWVKNSSYEQHSTMSIFNMAILRQMIKLAVLPVSSPKLANGSKIRLMSNIQQCLFSIWQF